MYSLIHPPDIGILKRVENLENALQFFDGPKDVSFLQKLDALEALIFGGPIIILPQDLLKTSGPTFDHIHLTSGQVGFPAVQVPSADPNTLDDYDEYTAASTACSGAITTAVAWKLVKIGRVVTLTMPEVYGAGTAVSSITYGLTIPAKYRPIHNIAVPCLIYDNAATQNQNGYIFIRTTGVINIYKTPLAANFTVTAQCGLLNAHSVSYLVA